MDIQAVPFHALPCRLQIFTINGVDAQTELFGYIEDTDRENAEPYGCGYCEFISSNDHKKEAMETYGITEEEFEEVQYELREVLRVGPCGWCI